MDFRLIVPLSLTVITVGLVLASPFVGVARDEAQGKPEAAQARSGPVSDAPGAAPSDPFMAVGMDESWRRGRTISGAAEMSDLTPESIRVRTKSMSVDRFNNIANEPHNWLVHGGDYFESRWSPLTQINIENVARLGLAWSFETGTDRALESTPIVVDGVMYTTGSYSLVFAHDARTGELLWEFDPEAPKDWARRMCCDVVNRGVAVWEGKVFVGTIDGRLIALDAGTGEPVWQVNTIDRTKPYSITGAPRVVKDKVIIGNGGAELGVRGYISAYDTETGELAWRFFVVPGDPAKPYEHRELEMAAKTWSGDKYWVYGGGGTAWDSMAYDPSLDMLYVGTGNGSPWNREVRSPGGGDNLFLSSILALRPDTGELVWYYQTTPGETWDYTATQTIILADLQIEGRMRNVLMQAPKNGFFYVLDRATGEVISADPFVKQTWAKGFDMASGRPVEDENQHFWDEPKEVFPGPRGGHNWQPMAFNPSARLVYIPALEESGLYMNEHDFAQDPLAWNLGIDLDVYADILEGMEALPQSNGYLKAWDPVERRVVWQVESPYHAYNGGILTTAGNLVFQGTADGRFVAYAADTGDVLWDAPVLTGIVAPPVTYEIDKVQYVAVQAGWGGSVIAAAGSADHPSAAQKYGNAGRLLVFRLDGGPLPALAERDRTIPEQPAIEAGPEVIREGAHQYMKRCSFCHGAVAISAGTVPDLRMMTPQTHARFADIVLGGTRAGQGMPAFDDLLTPEQTEAIRAYIVHRANLGRAPVGESPQD